MTLSLERRAALWGTRTAVVDQNDDRRVSYADLESEADAMARKLSALGVEAGDTVSVVSRNRVETLALLFAVRRLGGVLAPVSHRLTPATVERPLEVVDPEVVIHETAQRDLVREMADDRTHTFEEFGRIEGEEYDSVERDPEDSLLYLHTKSRAERGGYSDDDHEKTDDHGEIRVVDLPGRTVEWNCITAVAAWGLGRDDCTTTLLPFSDADGLLKLVLPLLYVGGRIVVSRAFTADDALSAVETEGVTVTFGGATEYRELVAADEFETTDFGGVEWVASRSALADDVSEALAREVPIVRAYGRVETGPNDLYRPVEMEKASRNPDCVGRPFPDCEARVVGEGHDPVSSGEVGELELRGPVTAKGYVGEDEGFPEWVPTGDLAYCEGGDYYVLGRVGEAVESANQRAHPRAIERVLEAREDVTAAGVVADNEGVLAVFVGDADPGELRGVVADELPEDATLRELDRVESLPRRPTGEPDRAELRRQFDGEERIGKE